MRKFSDEQLYFIRNWNVNLEFLEGVIRAGKSHIGLIKFMMKAKENNGKGIHLIMAKNNKVFERNILPLLEYSFPSAIYKPRAVGGSRIEWNGVVIYVVGFENETRWKDILGSNVATAYIDEINLATSYMLQELIGRTGAVVGWYILCTANPDDPDKDIYEVLNRCITVNFNPNAELFNGKNKNWHAWAIDFRFNPILTPAMIRDIRVSQLEGSIYYDTKILGLRKKAKGLIWGDAINNAMIVNDKDVANITFKRCGIGVDTSYSKETDDTIAFIYIGIDYSGKLYILDEWVHNNKDGILTASELPQKIADFADKNNKKWRYLVSDIFVDSADQNLINEGNKWVRSSGRRFRFLNSYKMKITDRIQAATGWIATGYYLIHENCPIHFKEMKNYSWSTKDKMIPVDRGDHTINGSQYSWAPFFGIIGPNK